MKKLIVAEKPSLAKNIMIAIGFNQFTKNDGYYEGDHYIVTWAFGHLLGLIDIEEYAPDYDPTEKHGWTLENLPFIPHTFRFELKKDPKTKKIDTGIRKQYKTIEKLAKRNDVECIIHAGDADREGEVIIKNILIHFHNTKPVKRLWMPDQTEQTIRSELKALNNDSNYENLFNEGLARTYIDWLYGVNLTRLSSIKTGTLLRVGRVIVPIVKAIYERDMEIKNFVPVPYFAIVSNEKTKGIEIELTSKKKFMQEQRNEAEAFCQKYNQEKAMVSSVITERKTIAPGKLYSLSKLQGVLGKKYKISPKESLEIVQKLYEAGYVTYPRTNSEYLASAEAGKVNHIIEQLNAKGYQLEPKNGKKSIYDDSKIESHSALTPTYKFPDQSKLSKGEQIVYEIIFNRFLAVFCAIPCEVDRTTITITVGNLEEFKIKGDTYVKKGWKEYENVKTEDKELPPLQKGEIVNIAFQPVEKETKPPKHYTVDSLNNYLKNPFKKESQGEEPENMDAGENTAEENEDYKAIFEGLELGTEATRTPIIQNAINSHYISLKNNSYYIEPNGIYMIEALQKLGIGMDKYKTAELGKALKQVYRGEISVEHSVALAAKEIKENFEHCKGIAVQKAETNNTEIIGKCPKCGGDVEVKPKGFFCNNKDCKFALWPTMKYFDNTLKITKTKAKTLLAGKHATFSLKSKAGKTYDGYLKMKINGEYVNFEPDGFPTKKTKKK